MAVSLILLLSPDHGDVQRNIRDTAKLFKIENPVITELPTQFPEMRRFSISDGGSLALPDVQGELFPHTCDLP